MEKRRYLSPAEKARVIDRQDGICACGCGEKLVVGQIDFDHEIPLHLNGTNHISNFVALIRRHHIKKTSKEATARAKSDRIRAKRDGTWLNAKDRELQRIMSKTKQLSPPPSR